MTAKFDIRAVLEHHGAENLPSRGGWAKIRCVIHDDSSPSASFNEKEGRFRCFACAFFGDAIDLVQEISGCTWGEAVDTCKKITGQSGEFSQAAAEAKPVRCRPVRLGDLLEGGASRPRQASTTSKPTGRRRPRRIA